MTRPLILVSNDDGVYAPGIRVLAECAAEYGDVVVSAPQGEQSGSSHAITLHSHLRAKPVRDGWFGVSGTPVDSVYLGVLHLCPRPPDLVIAGINDGYNLGSDVIYSGTVGAAREGHLRGASALAVSVTRGHPPLAAVASVRRLLPALWERHRAGERHLLNVNVAAWEQEEPQPVVVTTLGQRRYVDRVEKRLDLQGQPYYWIGGPPDLADDRPGEDTHAVAQGYVSVTPIAPSPQLRELKTWQDALVDA
ncbi:MAG: 5'/3'-nucleotidase SurE [Myxococcales bacterium FL481]|nr:MAG: 5'/3'-nucleotidase SurE [Myxococcales bacterium FL481]